MSSAAYRDWGKTSLAEDAQSARWVRRGSSRKLYGSPEASFSSGAASQAAIPMSCCSAARHTSSHGSKRPNRSFPQARASWPETHACAGCPMRINPVSSSRCSIGDDPNRARSATGSSAGADEPRALANQHRTRGGPGVHVARSALVRHDQPPAAGSRETDRCTPGLGIDPLGRSFESEQWRRTHPTERVSGWPLNGYSTGEERLDVYGHVGPGGDRNQPHRAVAAHSLFAPDDGTYAL